ncbi:TetR family transcriptional regulator [Streptomyces sp. NPDC097727]|uniref:TetR family transcriptional regulator n=1 Tax=Streptomyces sp. NPDC097727 TaxID=3366092 RepID=UPI003801E2AA
MSPLPRAEACRAHPLIVFFISDHACLDAAEEVFATSGYAASTLRALAKHIGMHPRAVRGVIPRAD